MYSRKNDCTRCAGQSAGVGEMKKNVLPFFSSAPGGLHDATATPRLNSGVGVTWIGSFGTVTKSCWRTNAVVSARSFSASGMMFSFVGC